MRISRSSWVLFAVMVVLVNLLLALLAVLWRSHRRRSTPIQETPDDEQPT